MLNDLIHYHAPNTRSLAVRILLEELDAPHRVQILNFGKAEQRSADYRAINPMGKVPAIMHNGALITEQAAIFIYLADAFPQAGLAPLVGDSLRGPYLRWLVFYSSCFEPALCDKALNREPGKPSMMPYGDYETTLKTVMDQLARGPYLTGERFTAADILWGTALQWMTMFKLVPETETVSAYVQRIMQRPAAVKMQAEDKSLAELQAAAA